MTPTQKHNYHCHFQYLYTKCCPWQHSVKSDTTDSRLSILCQTIYLSALVIKQFTCSVFLGSMSPSHHGALCTVLWPPSAPLLPQQPTIHSRAIANNVGWEAHAHTLWVGGKTTTISLACH